MNKHGVKLIEGVVGRYDHSNMGIFGCSAPLLPLLRRIEDGLPQELLNVDGGTRAGVDVRAVQAQEHMRLVCVFLKP